MCKFLCTGLYKKCLDAAIVTRFQKGKKNHSLILLYVAYSVNINDFFLEEEL